MDRHVVLTSQFGECEAIPDLTEKENVIEFRKRGEREGQLSGVVVVRLVEVVSDGFVFECIA